MSSYKEQLEVIHFHETTAKRLRDELDSDIEILIEEGLVSRPYDEHPVKATGKYVTKLVAGTLISAADVKEKVPATRDLSHRGISAMLSHHPAIVDSGDKDRHGLKLFRRVDEMLPIATAAE